MTNCDLYTAAISVVCLFTFFQLAHCDTRELYNTKVKTSDLKWTTIGWEEVSGFDQKRENIVRHYQICNSRLPDQSNWIRSPYINADDATRLHIEIEFSIQKCDTPDLADAKYCRETFNLFYYESDSDVASSTFPPWRAKPYAKVDTVAANTDGNINKKTFTIGPLKRAGLYVAAQDQGACMSINSMRVYYYYCPESTVKLATFPETKAGGQPTSLVSLDGVCVTNAQRMHGGEAPTYYCGSDGNWQILTGGCQCNAGYRQNDLAIACHSCPSGTFKAEAGDEQCTTCPQNSGPDPTSNGSETRFTGRTYCSCRTGYFRSLDESKATACTKPPSKPTEVNFKVNSTGALLQWSNPLDLGGRTDTTYSIKCMECTSKLFTTCRPCSSAVNMPSSSTGGSVSISGLKPYSPYLFRISSQNGVSKISLREPEYAEARVFTNEAAPSIITNIYVSKRYVRGVEIKWKPPLHPNGVILLYEIETILASENGKSSGVDALQAPNLKEVKDTHAIIDDLEPNTDYVVRIRSKNSVGFSLYSEMVQVSTMPETDVPQATQDPSNTIIIVIVSVVAVVCTVLVILFICYYRRKGHMPSLPGNKQKTITAQNGRAGNMERDSLIGHRIYVEYPDPNRAVKTLNKELDPNDLTVLEKLIGEGEFANVLHGKLMRDGVSHRVAVKQLKHGASVKDQSNFLREACSMAQFDHPNILQLKGVITKSRPVMIVSEYMQNGSLDEYLTKKQGEFSVLQLSKMLHGIANGMHYLSDMQYVHRDLAARNILVNSDLICKVSDFGLSRTLENDPHATYTTQGGKIAIRWAAPECIRYRQFTSASDVWSYGIVMWEVMSYGEKPYWDMTNQQVVQNIENGMRLPAPTNCPKVLHDKMLECWSLDPNNRPKFSKIVADLEFIKTKPALLSVPCEVMNGHIQTNNSSSTLAAACATPNLQHALNHGEITSVEEWLKCQRLDKYKDRFLAHGLDSLDKVSNLTIKDLRSLGIDVTLHVHKLENGIRSLRRHLSTSSSRPTSSLCPDDVEQGDDDVMVSPEEQAETKPMRNGSIRLPATQEETTILIPEGSVAV